MSRRVLEVELAGCGSLVRGFGSRDMVESITGRAPLWIRSERGWSVQESTARDVVSLAERHGYDIVITGRQPVPVTVAPPEPVEAAQPEAVGLW